MSTPLKRWLCAVRGSHPTVIWASEWRYGGLERTLESRCSDCGWVRWRRTEYRSSGPTATLEADPDPAP